MTQHEYSLDELKLILEEKINIILSLRKDLDLEKEEHQLTQLKYEKMKDNLDTLINDRLNAAKEAIQEVVK
tara:strand:- start:715 stop:927 length:213 start_codon:yes stop_codon:yes gene_type:complete